MDSESRNPGRAFKLVNGRPVEIDPPTEEQRRSMDEQQAAMFTPDGQLRMVVEMREKYRKGLLKLESPQPPQPIRFATLEDKKNQPPMSREELIEQSNGILSREEGGQSPMVTPPNALIPELPLKFISPSHRGSGRNFPADVSASARTLNPEAHEPRSGQQPEI